MCVTLPGAATRSEEGRQSARGAQLQRQRPLFSRKLQRGAVLPLDARALRFELLQCLGTQTVEVGKEQSLVAFDRKQLQLLEEIERLLGATHLQLGIGQ